MNLAIHSTEVEGGEACFGVVKVFGHDFGKPVFSLVAVGTEEGLKQRSIHVLPEV